MKVFSNTGRRYDLSRGNQSFTVYAHKDGTIINTTLGADQHQQAISEAIRTYHKA